MSKQILKYKHCALRRTIKQGSCHGEPALSLQHTAVTLYLMCHVCLSPRLVIIPSSGADKPVCEQQFTHLLSAPQRGQVHHHLLQSSPFQVLPVRHSPAHSQLWIKQQRQQEVVDCKSAVACRGYLEAIARTGTGRQPMYKRHVSCNCYLCCKLSYWSIRNTTNNDKCL